MPTVLQGFEVLFIVFLIGAIFALILNYNKHARTFVLNIYEAVRSIRKFKKKNPVEL